MIQDDAKVCKHCRRRLPSKFRGLLTFAIIGVVVFLVAQCAIGAADDMISMENARLDGDPPNAAQPSTVDLTQAYAERSWQSVCGDRYPSNFTMRAACGRNAMAGHSDFVAIRSHYQSDPAMMVALADCYSRYTISGSTNFSMAGACARNQEAGYQQVNQ